MNIHTKDYAILPGGKPAKISSISTKYDGELSKEKGLKMLDELLERLQELQALLYADSSKALLVVFQAMDAAGKDSTIRNVFGRVNPQGCKVVSFKSPNSTELLHDFLWRVHQNVPRKGYIGVFNRSYYEDVLIVKVKNLAPRETVEKRYDHINAFESLLSDEGTKIVKFFLHISKDYQKEQLQERLDTPEKLWKFTMSDIQERAYWDDYQSAYETVFEKCCNLRNPWHVVPAERKWFRNLLVAKVLVETLESMNLQYPKAQLNPKDIVIP